MHDTRSELDHDLVSALGVEHGWPFYLADIERLDSNIVELGAALSRSVETPEIGYSFKTNYLAAFIDRARRCGVAAEIVSELEFDYAIDLGFTGHDIIVNGPIKRQPYLERGLGLGARVNVDSLEEICSVAEIGRVTGRLVQVGIRVSTSFGGSSRFGIDLDDDGVLDALRRVLADGHVEVVGVQCHTSGLRSAESFQFRLRRIAEAYDRLRPGVLPVYLDVGGGMMGSVPDDLARQLPGPSETYIDYAVALGATLVSLYGDTQPRLIVEPGMGLLADTMSLYAPVVSVKRSSGQRVAVVMASILDVKPLRGAINPSVQALRPDGTSDVMRLPSDRLSVGGNTCMEIDVLHTGLEVSGGALQPGDVLQFRNVGAYSISLRPNFIEPAPAVVESSAAGGVGSLLRPRMTATEFGFLYGRRA